MADQADFPDIYIDSSVEAGGVGSEADPYSAFSEINWTTGGDYSIFDYYAGSPAASVTINLKRGETWATPLLSTSGGGSSLYPLIIQAYGTITDPNPIIDLGFDISTASYKWTLSQAGTNEYYLEAAAGGTPGLTNVRQVFIDGARCDLMEGLGTLNDHGFDFGHNAADEAAPNSKAVYDTVYIRDDSGDPDVTGVLVEASQGNEYALYLRHEYITVQNITVKRSNGHGVRLSAENITVKDCLMDQCFYGCGGWSSNCTLDGVEIDNAVGAAIGFSGTVGNEVEGILVTGCTVHDTQLYLSGGWPEGAGTKLFAIKNCTFTKSTWYNNAGGAIRFDGLNVVAPHGGCDYCEVSYNLLYGNGYQQIELEYSSNNIIKFNYCHSPATDIFSNNGNITLSHTGSDSNKVFGNICCDSVGTSNFVNQTNAGAGGANEFVANISYNGRRGFTIYDNAAILKNNIVFGSVKSDLIVGVGIVPTSDYNCFAGTGTDLAVYVDGESPTDKTLAQWQAFSEQDAHSFDGDPLLTNPAGGDFTFQAGSPCIGAGDESLGPPYNEGIISGAVPDTLLTGDRDDY